jgi:nitrogen fixation-related uncharacterized protein
MLKYVDTIPKRLAISVSLMALCLGVDYFFRPFHFSSSGFFIVLIAGFFILLTLYYAVVSTFFTNDDKKNDEILDD